MKKSLILLSGVSAIVLAYSASAETPPPSAQAALTALNAGGGSDRFQWQVGPTYSEDFGLGIHSSVGGYLSDDFALGVIVDYAAHRQEYLANAGIQLNDKMRLIGSFGLLRESEEFTLGDGRQDVSQREYGLSLKGSYEAGPIRGYEINAYRTNAFGDADSVETGDLTGIQFVTQLKPSDASDLRIGAGFERAEWNGGEVDEGLTLQALGALKMSDMVSLNYSAKSAQTENDYGFGLTYDLSNPDLHNSTLSLGLNQIQGKHGISDDTHVAINWTIGLGGAAGAGANATVSSKGGIQSIASIDLIADVMTRPAFLPERVLSSLLPVKADICPEFSVDFLALDASGSYFWVSKLTLTENINDLSNIRWYLYKTDDPSTVIEGTYSENDGIYSGNAVRFQDPGYSIQEVGGSIPPGSTTSLPLSCSDLEMSL